MNKIVFNLCVVILLATLSACKNDGKQIASSKAEVVTITESESTITFNKIKTGSYLDWRASHLGGIDPRIGKIYLKKAAVLVNTGTITNMNIIIDMSSLTVDNLAEDNAYDLSEHLKHEDFFNVDKYPTSKFELTNLKAIQGEYNSEVTGNLTILDISKSITFKASINTSENEIAIKSEDFIIDRAEWEMTYNSEGTTGVSLDYLISDDVGFTIDIAILRE